MSKCTPLHLAATNHHEAACRVLVEAGADVEALDIVRYALLDTFGAVHATRSDELIVCVYDAWGDTPASLLDSIDRFLNIIQYCRVDDNPKI